eukprot:3934423-Rhodomonas_salina.1
MPVLRFGMLAFSYAMPGTEKGDALGSEAVARGGCRRLLYRQVPASFIDLPTPLALSTHAHGVPYWRSVYTHTHTHTRCAVLASYESRNGVRSGRRAEDVAFDDVCLTPPLRPVLTSRMGRSRDSGFEY